MLEKLSDFLLAHGFKIMMTGFAVSATGIIFYIQQQHKDQMLRKVAFGVTVAGVALYITGRICVYAGQRRARKQREQADSGTKE